MRMSPPGSSHGLALPLILVLLAAVAPAVQAEATSAQVPGDGATALQDEGQQETVRYTVEAHDAQDHGETDYWFTWNATGDVKNPPALLPAGTHVVIEFTNRGEEQHNLHVGGPIDESTELIGTDETRTLEFTVPEDAPESFEYWCDPHKGLGMKGNATTSEEAFEEQTTEELTVAGHDEGGSEYWFTTEAAGEARNPPILLKPGYTYEVTFENEGDVEHNLHFGGPLDVNTTLIAGGETETMTFTVPSNVTGTFDYWCDPHKGLGMVGTTYTSVTEYEQALSEVVGGEEEHMDIEALGVDYLAYWVGVISFATLFILYGLYFFLFKYESGTTTDHKDRTGAKAAEEDPWNRQVGRILFLATVAIVLTLAAAQLGYV